MGESDLIFMYDEDKKKKLKTIAAREGTTIKQIMTELADDYIKKHGDSNNPQSEITQFNRQEIIAIPNFYEENLGIWAKFFSHVDRKEYKLLEQQHTMFTKLMNKKNKELFDQ